MAVAAPETFSEPVVIYTTRYCGYCMMALRLLRGRGIEHAQVPVDGDAEARRWLERRTGRSTVPQVFIRGDSIGGYDDLSALDRSGQLATRIAVATRDGDG
jgi:glutaredoxin 3